jgi:hypothetical protein
VPPGWLNPHPAHRDEGPVLQTMVLPKNSGIAKLLLQFQARGIRDGTRERLIITLFHLDS